MDEEKRALIALGKQYLTEFNWALDAPEGWNERMPRIMRAANGVDTCCHAAAAMGLMTYEECYDAIHHEA